MVHAHGSDFEAAAGDPLTQRTLTLFFELLRMLLEREVTVVAEAAFQDRLWRQGLEPLLELAQLRIVQASVDPAVAHARHSARGKRDAHAAILGTEIEDWRSAYETFERLSLPAPSLEVDTADGYTPSLDEIIAFVNRGEPTG
jgi:predicted kinase